MWNHAPNPSPPHLPHLPLKTAVVCREKSLDRTCSPAHIKDHRLRAKQNPGSKPGKPFVGASEPPGPSSSSSQSSVRPSEGSSFYEMVQKFRYCGTKHLYGFPIPETYLYWGKPGKTPNTKRFGAQWTIFCDFEGVSALNAAAEDKEGHWVASMMLVK